MTGLADWMRTLSPDDAAAAVVRALERGGRLVVSPFRLRLMLRTARVFPAATEFFHRKTTRPRPAAPGP